MRRTKEESQQTREAILNAAVKTFVEKGVAKTSLEEIARAAKVTRGAIYWHFKNKTEIFDALYERLHLPLVDMIVQDVEKDLPHPLRQIQELCANFLLDLEKNTPKRQALTLFLMKCDYSGELARYKDKHADIKERKIRLSARYFENAKKKGLLAPDADPKLLTLALTCYMKGIVLEYLEDPAGFDMGRKAPKLVAQFFEGLGGGAG